MLRRILTLNFLDAFIAGMTTVLVPLLMQSRGIGIAEIGLAFSLSPFVKVIVRLAGASLADFLGDRAVYLGNAAANLLQSACYLFGTGPAWFAAGKFFDGVRESLIFSVNRASLMAAAPDRKHFALSSLLSGRFLYNAAGGLAVGVLAGSAGFDLLLSAMAALSAYMVLTSLGLKTAHHSGEMPRLSDFSIKGRGRRFYETAAALCVGSWIYIAMIYMLLPLYFSQRGFALSQIGMLYSAYFITIGAAMHALSHFRVKSSDAALFGAAIFCAALPGIALAGNDLLPLFFVLMALGDGFLGVLWEEVNYLAVKGSRKRATELAVLNTPAYLSVFLATALSGFAASTFGYLPLFALFALSEAAFAAWGLRLARMKE